MFDVLVLSELLLPIVMLIMLPLLALIVDAAPDWPMEELEEVPFLLLLLLFNLLAFVELPALLSFSLLFSSDSFSFLIAGILFCSVADCAVVVVAACNVDAATALDCEALRERCV